MNINPGKLDKRIEIIEKIRKRGKNGFQENSEKVIRKPWASFRRTTGKEKLEAGKEMDVVEVRFVIRASTDLTTDMAIRYDGNLYDIKFINNYNDSNEYIEIWATLEV